MTIQEALNIIDVVASAYKGSRQEHITLQSAMDVIKSAVQSAPNQLPTEEQEDENKSSKK